MLQVHVEKFPHIIKYIDDNNKEDYIDLCCIAIAKKPELILKCKVLYYRSIMCAINLNGKLVKQIPNYTPEMVNAAIDTYGKAIGLLYYEQQTENMIIRAIKQNGMALEKTLYICDPNMIRIALASRGKVINLLMKYKVTITKELMMIALNAPKFKTQDSRILNLFRKDMDVIKAMVRVDGLALDYYYEYRNNKEIIKIATDQSPFSLEYIGSKSKSRELVMKCVSREGVSIEYARRFRSDFDIALCAVSQCGSALKYLPEFAQGKLPRSKEIVMAAVKQNGDAINYSPYFASDYEVALCAVKSSAMAYAQIPNHMKPQLLPEAVKNARYNFYHQFQHDPQVFNQHNLGISIKNCGYVIEITEQFDLDMIKAALLYAKYPYLPSIKRINRDVAYFLVKDYNFIYELLNKRELYTLPKIKSKLKLLIEEFVKVHNFREIIQLIKGTNIELIRYLPTHYLFHPQLMWLHYEMYFSKVKKLSFLRLSPASINIAPAQIKCCFNF